jgi:hypothetical protein
LTARSALEKFAAVQMIDVHLPTTDGRELVLTRYTQPEPELQLLINQLKFQLPPQPPEIDAVRAVRRSMTVSELSTVSIPSRPFPRTTAVGHEERFPQPRLSAGCRFRKETIARMICKLTLSAAFPSYQGCQLEAPSESDSGRQGLI